MRGRRLLPIWTTYLTNICEGPRRAVSGRIGRPTHAVYSSHMDAKGYLLTQVLGNVRLEIPPWQRRYSWKVENWEALWQSLSEVADGRRVAPHFLGALVFQGEKVKSGIVQYRVIDGQQRLITLSLVLAAIRRKLAAYPETAKRRGDLASVGNLMFSPGGVRKEDLKIAPYGADLDAYWASIETPDAIPTGRVAEAYKFFSERISPMTEKQLVGLRDGMSGRLFFALVFLTDKEDANRIFRSLNESGLTLSPTDHIRNQLFMSAGGRGDSLYSAHWEPLEDALGDNLLSFLFADLARQPHEAQSLQKSQLHRVYGPKFDALSGSATELTNYIETLERDGGLYRASGDPSLLESADVPNPAKLERPLWHLAEWGSQPAETFILDALVRYCDGELQLSQVTRALHSIESFLVRRFLAGERANLLSRIFMDLINQFPADGTYAARLRRALSHPAHSWPTTLEVDRSVTTTLNFYAQGAAAQRRYILKELNGHLVRDGRLKRDAIPPAWPSDLTIEHIMPQTLDAWWRERLAEERKANGWSESVDELHSANVNLLGNLTLAKQDRNDKYGNKPFPEKVALINQELPIRLNARLGTGDYKTWGIAAIRKRNVDLAALGCRIWEGPSGR